MMMHFDAFPSVRADERFIENVAYWLQRPLTDDEEGIAFDARDLGGYTAQEAAEEIRATVAE